MIINIKVIANAKENKIIEQNGVVKIYLTTQREKGKANKALIKILSKYYNVPKSYINIIKGETTNIKQVEITVSKK